MKTILIVDDDADIIEVVKSRLEANSYNVATAYDGKQALEKINKQQPDLIIVDILMPNMDGYTLVKEIKAKKELKSIPIIILTAKDKMKDLFAMEGIKDYVVKPFQPQELLDKVKHYIS